MPCQEAGHILDQTVDLVSSVRSREDSQALAQFRVQDEIGSKGGHGALRNEYRCLQKVRSSLQEYRLSAQGALVASVKSPDPVAVHSREGR